ncbi:hypothetical protein [uncultured Roseobacter sp.]|uniref:hypothetical protein n=1 Tax=uncultured Roseobacter sp. TaxID=114847 RepID=UPI002621805D|nr:hypothetical protein [uncultured Roseobacter sp.]
MASTNRAHFLRSLDKTTRYGSVFHITNNRILPVTFHLKLFAASLVLLGACDVANPPILEEAIVLEEGVTAATRSFAAPSQFPPQDFAAYGILAFPTNPKANTANRARFDRFCGAFVSGIESSEYTTAQGIPTQQQMVTVLPVTFEAVVDEAFAAVDDKEACDLARDNYGLLQAQQAIKQANAASERTDGIDELSGRGPFLIAWSPGTSKGEKDAIVLVSDLSNSTSQAQAEADIRLWVTTIQLDQSLWRRGWNRERLRLAGQRWIDRRATSVLKLVGALL